VPGPSGERGRPRAAWPSAVEEAVRSQRVRRDRQRTTSASPILGPLRDLDEIAYLRFASVYQAFDNLEDFESAITLLRAERDAAGIEPPGRMPSAHPAG
jgi:transcriptional repressor NrdR